MEEEEKEEEEAKDEEKEDVVAVQVLLLMSPTILSSVVYVSLQRLVPKSGQSFNEPLVSGRQLFGAESSLRSSQILGFLGDDFTMFPYSAACFALYRR